MTAIVDWLVSQAMLCGFGGVFVRLAIFLWTALRDPARADLTGGSIPRQFNFSGRIRRQMRTPKSWLGRTADLAVTFGVALLVLSGCVVLIRPFAA